MSIRISGLRSTCSAVISWSDKGSLTLLATSRCFETYY